MAPVFIFGAIILFYLTRSCPSGQNKDAYFSCDYYKRIKDVKPETSGNFKCGGTTALINLHKEIESKINFSKVFSLSPVNIKTSNQIIPWSGEAIQQLIDKRIDVALSSRDLHERELQKAKKMGITLKAIPIAKDGLAFFVNKDQKIDKLRIDDIAKIYTGEITNWNIIYKQNNLRINQNEDLKINAFSPDPIKSKIPEYFEGEIMKNIFAGDIKEGDPTAIIREVAKSRNGIGFASAVVLCGNKNISIKPLEIKNDGGSWSPCTNNNLNEEAIADNKYPLTRQLYVIIAQDGKEREKAGITFVNMILSNEGQQYVRRAGYVPIR